MSILETPSGKSPSFTSMERGRKSGIPILKGKVRTGKGQKRHAQHQRLTPDEMGNQREKKHQVFPPGRYSLQWRKNTTVLLTVSSPKKQKNQEREVTPPMTKSTFMIRTGRSRSRYYDAGKNPRQVSFFIFKVNGQAPARAVQCLPIYRPNPTHG